MRELNCDVLVVGGGTGGCAAALAAARHGKRVILLEETDWLGGQLTAQAVSALDEHPWIERFGATESYYQVRNGIRQHYAATHKLSADAFDAPHFNPGDCWVTNCAFEPEVAVKEIERLLAPWEHQIEIHFHSRVIGLDMDGDRIASAHAAIDGQETRILADIVVDATELGDLLPMAGAEYAVGREGREETGEPDAYDQPDPACVQSFTYPFIVEYCPGENHTIPKPKDYERLKELQQYSFNDGAIRRLFAVEPGEWATLWTYRRLLAKRFFDDPKVPNDVCLINTKSNDYRGASVIDKPANEVEMILEEARNASLGFLYWMQTEAPRHDGEGVGYPELKLRRDLVGTDHGCSKTPYFRESRRMKTVVTIKEQDVVVRDGRGNLVNVGPRGANFEDSVGIGRYQLDCHRSVTGDEGRFWPTRPFQIPLGAFIPRRITNLLPGCKNLGTTHLSNGAYRLHPIEWAIGEAAGVIAALAGETPLQAFYENKANVLLAQQALLRDGAPLYWYIDVPFGMYCFHAVQILAVQGRFAKEPQCDLNFRPHDPLSRLEAEAWGTPELEGLHRGEAAQSLAIKLLLEEDHHE